MLDQIGIVEAALGQIVNGFGVAMELELIEGGGLVQQPGRGNWRRAQFPLQMTNTFTERETQRKLQEANEVTAAPAAVAIEEIFAGIDVERGSGFTVQGTPSDELLPSAGRASPPVEPPQVIQKRKLLFELLQILAGHASHADSSLRGSA